MLNLVRRFIAAHLFRGVRGPIAMGIFSAMVVATTALGASIVVSNVLNLGSTQLMSYSIKLTQDKGLPASIEIDKKVETRFGIANEGSSMTGAALKVGLSASDTTLTNPGIVAISFRDRETGSETPVTLTAVNGKLEGVLRSNWTVPQGYQGEADLEVTFKSGAPPASYDLSVWVEKGDTAANPIPVGGGGGGNPSGSTPATHDVGLNDDDKFSPKTITVKAGDTVKWTNSGDKPHSVTFSDPSIPDKDMLPGGQTYQAVFSQAGSFSYLCLFHSGMSGTVVVQ